MTNRYFAILAGLALFFGLSIMVTGLFQLFGAWALVVCGVLLSIPILFVDVEESDNG